MTKDIIASGWNSRTVDGIEYFYVEALERTGLAIQGFSSRVGGVSAWPYASLNQGLHVGDDPQRVMENRHHLFAALGLSFSCSVVPAQVHGDLVHLASRQDAGAGTDRLETAIPDCDALITNETGLPLVTHHADCAALLILDPEKRAVGLAHAGWKGTVKKIGVRTIEEMGRAFGTRPQDCLVGISPSIGPCCYEVDAPVLEQFAAAFDYFAELIQPRPNRRAVLDLWQANRRPLLEIGVREESIFVSRLCTCCREQHFFSYRREAGGITGRMAAFIMLRDKNTGNPRA